MDGGAEADGGRDTLSEFTELLKYVLPSFF